MFGLAAMDIAARHGTWLAARHALVSENVANAGTPGYRAREVGPFASMLPGVDIDLRRTNPNHISGMSQGVPNVVSRSTSAWETSYSGNNVSLDQQSVAAAEIRQAFILNVNVVRTLNRMITAAVKA